MSTFQMPELDPLPDFLQTEEPVTLNSIRNFRETTVRGKGDPELRCISTALELEIYLNQAKFDLSMRISRIKRYLKNEGRSEITPPDLMSELGEMLRELKFCSDIGTFAISQMAPRN